MSSDGADLGRAVEAAVADLCTASFFPDTVVRSPKYRKKDGQQKEAADLLVMLNETLLVFQVKTRVLPVESSSGFSPVEEARFQRILGKALDQFRAVVEATNNGGFEAFVNDRGLPVKLRFGQSKRVSLVVVYAILLPDGSRPQINVRCTKSCIADGPIPIHVFTLDEFMTLVRLLDTLPDFTHYLELRGDLQEVGLIRNTADPIDVWALITFEAETVKSAVKSTQLIETDGMQSRHEPSLAQLEERERPSYFIDWLLNQLHAGTGSKVEVPDWVTRNAAEVPGSLEAYQRQMPYLAQLNRWQRGQLADALSTVVVRAQDGGNSFRAVKFERLDTAYLVLCRVGGERQDRHIAMRNLGLGLAHTLQVQTVVCIATGPAGPEVDGCDVLAVKIDPANISPAIVAEAKKWFGPPRRSSGS